MSATQETRERLERALAASAAADLSRAEEARDQAEHLRTEEQERRLAAEQPSDLACDPVQDPSALAMVAWPPVANMRLPAMVRWPTPSPVVEFQVMAMQQVAQAMAYRQLTMWPR